MRRRTLDLFFSVGGLVLAILVLALGLVLQNQANFAKDYVAAQMAEQRITFTPADKLSDEEKKAACLVENAGQPLSTGAQAECYANEYIGLHVTEINGGKTYSETSNEARALATKAAAALKANPDDPAAKDMDTQAKALNGKTDTLFKGETLRGLLLTSYGFSIFGERAQQAAYVAYLVAVVLLIASIAGFIHAFATPKDEVVLQDKV
jgi:hypothetical protein